MDKLATAFIMGMLGRWEGLIPKKYRPDPKPMKKCILPNCQNLTNKGYCCAEHSRKHDELIREKRKINH